MKLHLASLLLVTLVLSSLFLDFAVAGPTKAALTKTHRSTRSSHGVCDYKCGVRCSKAGLKKRCMKYCGICCAACKCVPSGTYGNKSECPCYRDKLNSRGKPKCP